MNAFVIGLLLLRGMGWLVVLDVSLDFRTLWVDAIHLETGTRARVILTRT